VPYKSERQRRWAHTAEGKKKLGLKAIREEFDRKTKERKLPEWKKGKRR
jgi:hypothetical protein